MIHFLTILICLMEDIFSLLGDIFLYYILPKSAMNSAVRSVFIIVK